jgi:hypothetical protein
MDPLKLRRKKAMLGSAARAELKEQANEELQMLTPLEQQRLKYKQKKRAIGNREAEVRHWTLKVFLLRTRVCVGLRDERWL